MSESVRRKCTLRYLVGKGYHVCSLLTNSSAKVPGKSTKQMQNNWLKVWANIIILKLLAKLKKKGAIWFFWVCAVLHGRRCSSCLSDSEAQPGWSHQCLDFSSRSGTENTNSLTLCRIFRRGFESSFQCQMVKVPVSACLDSIGNQFQFPKEILSSGNKLTSIWLIITKTFWIWDKIAFIDFIGDRPAT